MDKLVTLDHVSKHFHVGKGKNLVAVNDISLDIYKGETLGVVGESGCGKSTLGRVVMGIYPATSGKMLYNGKQVNLRHTKDRYEYSQKAQIIFLLIAYKVIDGFADVYESEFQRQGCLYLTGRSNTFRTILSVGVFLVTLVSGAGLFTACVAAVLGQMAGVLLFDIVVLKELKQVDYDWSAKQGVSLTASSILLFVSVFLDFYIFSAAKYAIDAHLGDAASGYFNVIFMPTSVINLAAGFVIRPFLTYLTDCWNERRFQDFKKKLLTIMAVIGGLTVLAVGGTVVFGRPVLALLEWLLGASYSGKLTALWPAFIMIVLGGGFYAVLNLYYYALVILRKQKLIFGIYVVLTVLAVILAPKFTVALGIFGAALAYLILMVVMAAGFVGGAWIEIQQEIREVRHDG